MITVDYIWLDGKSDSMPSLRSKTRVFTRRHALTELPDWSFDGGSTAQGSVGDSDRTLRPVRLYKNPFSEGNYFVLCEVYNPEGTPHESNHRAKLRKLDPDSNIWFGFEQEYTFVNPTMQPLVPEEITQGEFYCGIGAGKQIGRFITDNHLKWCFEAGITLFGSNAEVMLSQWEYQTNPQEALKAADDLWMARYILERGSEQFNMAVSYHPKIYKDLNGAGCHVNVSTPETRESFDSKVQNKIMKKFSKTHKEHVKSYGPGNELRLTGECETSDFDKFTWGIGDRSVSVRIPSHVAHEEKGYFGDRRPAATCDPYIVTTKILETLD